MSLLAGLVYFAIVFAGGLGLGAIRTLWIAPLTGELTAVLVELPLILAISWVVCRKLVVRFNLPRALGSRLPMGASALALLLAAEAGLSVFGFGRSLNEHLTTYYSASGSRAPSGSWRLASFPSSR
jgi:hypothetical protein